MTPAKPSAHFGIIAHPVKHSLTPAMYSAACKTCKLRAVCEKIEVGPEKLCDFIKSLPTQSLNGFAVSVPHKEDIISYLDEVDPVAREIGAVNTVKVTPDGKLIGYNTDWIGVTEAFNQHFEKTSARMTSAKWKKTLVIGGRGIARGAAYALKKMGAHVFITNRTMDRAEQIAREFDIETVPFDFSVVRETYDIVINSTVVGLDSYTSPVPVQFWEQHGNGIAFDAIYRPAGTRFLIEAERAGWETIRGELMLARQAAPQFKILTGKSVDVSVFDKAIHDHMEDYKKSHARYF